MKSGSGSSSVTSLLLADSSHFLKAWCHEVQFCVTMPDPLWSSLQALYVTLINEFLQSTALRFLNAHYSAHSVSTGQCSSTDATYHELCALKRQILHHGQLHRKTYGQLKMCEMLLVMLSTLHPYFKICRNQTTRKILHLSRIFRVFLGPQV